MESRVSLIIKESFWNQVYIELGKRGQGETESGAFLLAKEDSNEIVDVLYYDDLEPGCLDSGAIHLTNKAFIRLADYCVEKRLTVVADIHTHPGGITMQSRIDKENPMIKIRGHIGIILPYFARKPECGLERIGLHEFLGNGFRWRSYKYSEGILTISDNGKL